MKNKIFIIILLLFFVSACSGMGSKRSDKSDEFLIEKKSPLVMPPDMDNLPKPKESAEAEVNENKFKKTLKSSSSEKQNSKIDSSSTLQESIIKKIE